MYANTERTLAPTWLSRSAKSGKEFSAGDQSITPTLQMAFSVRVSPNTAMGEKMSRLSEKLQRRNES